LINFDLIEPLRNHLAVFFALLALLFLCLLSTNLSSGNLSCHSADACGGLGAQCVKRSMEYVEEVYSAFERDPLIDELGVILSQDPPFVLLIDHKIGLSMAILKPLFLYTSTNLQPPLLSSHSQDDKLLEKLSLGALLVKGDFPPALAVRKRLIQKGALSPLGELKFIQVILSKHSKSPSCWHHRRWCLEYLQSNSSSSAVTESLGPLLRSTLWPNELLLCERMCDIYPRNYYSWNHRLWISQQLDDENQVLPSPSSFPLLPSEPAVAAAVSRGSRNFHVAQKTCF
jgi:hypothetical protein